MRDTVHFVGDSNAGSSYCEVCFNRLYPDGIPDELTSERAAYEWAKRNQGFEGDFAAWLALPQDEREVYEQGAAGIPTVEADQRVGGR